MTSADAGVRHLGVRGLLAAPGFRRLLATRLAAQWGDGLFQAGLAGAVLFNPEREAEPGAIAAGFAVLLLPYSLLGPFAGALLDRWDRRRVLVVAALLRALFVLLTASAVGSGLDGVPLYAAALLVTGVSRFTGSGLSASLPHVVPRAHLVEANAVATTAGSVTAVVGAATAVLLRGALGAGDGGSAWTTACAAAGSLLAAALAAGFARDALGPDTGTDPGATRTLTAVAHGLLDGGGAVLRTPAVRSALAALVAHRMAFGMSLVVTLLLMRNSFTDQGPFRAGLAGLGQVAACGGAGVLLAGLVTDRLVGALGRARVVPGALGLAALTQLGLGLPMRLPAVLAAAFLLTFAGQVVKLCADAAVQAEIGDEVRGRVFALYDTLFNVTQVVAVSVAAALVAHDGRSPGLVLAAALVHPVGALGHLLLARPGGGSAGHR
ncbi:MFS transporter [Actinosynnema mirum]|uniref:Major facilitator superfamily MFS_1 n=1 Tax=Actinosynnema mirum (strain ATCC 29888 / DSM 43827 / JCM 3225 / NBRC 14064 / NCIMB 13271 / NRRL B-12336 / IMRU 3971 / 101) TaxID=446462 RepID=C6WSJ8_ACTMD|nr:MFS transporter [Actinosynnema mirum]ACU40868.1 major facilitator superfamily MFS_1 [Actinosynnema mirum DSM 43827]